MSVCAQINLNYTWYNLHWHTISTPTEWFNLGVFHEERGESEEKLTCFDKVTELPELKPSYLKDMAIISFKLLLTAFINFK